MADPGAQSTSQVECAVGPAEKFEVLGSRRSWHILVQSQDEAAEAQAESILREIRRAEDPRAVYDRYGEGGAGDAEFKLKAEELPAITEKTGIEKPYVCTP